MTRRTLWATAWPVRMSPDMQGGHVRCALEGMVGGGGGEYM